MIKRKHILVFLSIFLQGIFQFAGAQGYKSSFPTVDVLLIDSSTIYQTKTIAKDKPVVLLTFNTTCEHCQHMAQELTTKKNQLENILFVMISTESISTIRNFYNQYSLSKMKGLIIGRDLNLVTPRLFMYESFPFCAIYTRKHQFIGAFERNFTADTIINELKKNREL
ncbi:MAG: hypothetical protein ABI688_08825 [Bacteroidota bacterium]